MGNVVRLQSAGRGVPAEFMRQGSIDLELVAQKARAAVQSSDQAIQRAEDITDGNFLTRMWNSSDLQKNLITAITGISDLAKVNMALSVMCNDLAAGNLSLSKKIDENHQQIADQVDDTHEITSELLNVLKVSGGAKEGLNIFANMDALRQETSHNLDLLTARLNAIVSEVNDEKGRIKKDLDDVKQSMNQQLSHRDTLIERLGSVTKSNFSAVKKALGSVKQDVDQQSRSTSRAFSDIKALIVKKDRDQRERVIWVFCTLLVLQIWFFVVLYFFVVR